MAHFRRDITYSALDNELTPPLARSAENTPTMITLDQEHDDATNVIIHKVPQTKGNAFFFYEIVHTTSFV